MALTRPRAAQIYDIDYKQATRVVTVTNITLSGGAPNQVDGVNLSLKDRVLVTGQNTASQNGIYYVTTLGSGSNGTWSRSLDTDATGELLSGTIVMVTEGTIYADTQWKIITNDPITVGVTDQIWVQNYSANSISSGNSNVVVLTNANVLLSSAGTANVVDVFGSGIKITGTESVTGNTTVGNLLTAGLITATGNITGNYILGNVFFANGITASKIYSGTSEVNVTSSGGNVNVTIGGTSNVVVFSTAGEYITGLLSVTGNTTSGNLLTAGLITATGNITTAGYFLGNVACASGIYATKIFNGTTEANIGAANSNLAISVNGTSNVAVFATTGEYITGLVSVTGNVIGGNVSTAGLITATGNITGGNILTAGLVSATGNVTGSYLKGNASQITGVNTFNQIFVTGATTVNASTLTSNVTFAAGANIALTSDGNTITIAYTSTGSGSIFATGGDMGLIANPVTASEDLGDVTTVASTSYDLGTLFTTSTFNQIDMTGFTANVNTGNLNAVGLVSAVGNVYGAYVFGNGSQLTGVVASATFPLANGTSNINATSGGNITIGVGGTSNVAVFATTGEYVTGVVSASGNVTGGNVVTAGLISSTGNVTGGNIRTAGLISATGNITGGNIIANGSSLTGIGLIKAWVNFNANATVNGSFNVANVVNVSTGVYTINFTTALSNANYCPLIVASFQSGVTEVVIATVYNDAPYAPTASNVTVSFHNTAGTRVNPTFGYVTIVGT